MTRRISFMLLLFIIYGLHAQEADTSKAKPVDPSEVALQRYFNSKAIFWTEGPISRRGRGKGGRGGRGGV